MNRPDQIPDEVVEAAERTYRTVPLYTTHAEAIRAAITAAINVWPEAEVQAGEYAGKPYEDMILPLPPEAGGA